jgi:hypothetical protein
MVLPTQLPIEGLGCGGRGKPDEFKYQLSIELQARENLCYLCYEYSDWSSFTGHIGTNEPDDLGSFTREHIEQECKYSPAVLHLENQD